MNRRIILVDIGSGLTLTGVLPSVLLYDDYAATLKTRGGQPPYVYTLASGALPDGLSLDRATGIINGTTSAAGSFAFTVRVTDLSGAFVDRPFMIAVTAEPLTLAGNAPNGTIGTAYAYSYTPAGGVPPRTYSIVSGALPGGVVLNAGTGALSGTPTTGGSFAWTVRVGDSLGGIFDLPDSASIAYAALTLSGAFAAATVGVAYSSDLTIAGGDGSYSNPRATVGSVPSWGALSIVGSPGAYKLRLSGTPTGSATTVNITVAVDSGDGQTATSAQSFGVTTSVVSLDLSMTGSNGGTTFPDSGPNNFSVSVFGDTHTQTSGVPAGGSGGSATYFDGTGDYLKLAPANALNVFGTGDFSIKLEVYAESVATEQVILDATYIWPGSSTYLLEIRAGGDLRFYAGNGNPVAILGGAGSLTAGAWHTVEAKRVSGTVTLSVDGITVGTTTSTANISMSAAPTTIGIFGPDNTTPWKGWMRKLKITKG